MNKSPRVSFRLRVGLMLTAYAAVSALVLGSLLLKLRAEAIVAGENVLGAMAQLTEEQTTRIFENVGQTLEIVAEKNAASASVGTAATATMRNELTALLTSRPYLRAIAVLDRRGLVVFSSEAGSVGVDLSDRAYFGHHRDNDGKKIQFGAPLRGRLTGEWLIPVTQRVRPGSGEFDGVIVVSIDPMFFARAWTVENTVPDHATALWDTKGTMLMRSPFSDSAMGSTTVSRALLAHLNSAEPYGTFEAVSRVDGIVRLIAYRRVAAYPGLVLTVTQPMERVLAGWRDIMWMSITGWLVVLAMLSGLVLWLIGIWKARRVMQQRYRMLFNANLFPMLVMDRASRRFLDVNDAALKQYGYTRSEAMALAVDSLYLPDELVRLKALRLTDPVNEARVVEGFHHRRKNGTVFDVEMHARAIEIDGRPAILTTAENVSPRHAVEAQLRQAQKMEAVGQLTGGIAHDFNNILTIILANADALQEEENIDPGVAARLEQIGSAVGRAAGLTHQLLAFSRQQPLHPKRTDVNDLVVATGKLLRRALGEQIEIESVLSDGLWTIDIDRAQLETALVNLAINARDAMPNGGKLRLETRNAKRDRVEDDVAVGEYVLLTVSDTGTGMPPDVVAKVFEPFFTTKEVGKGTGLGLSMVYGFIKQSEGHIEIESEVGRGTSFRLYLPRSRGSAQEPSAAMPREAVNGGSERLLVVEDDDQVRTNVVMQLRTLGYSVLHAPDGAAGVAAFEAAALKNVSRPFDLLLTDLVMPGALNGKGLADVVAARWPATRVVFMSGYSENVFVRAGQVAPGIRLLPKPFRKKDLAAMIRAALDDRASGRVAAAVAS